MQQYAAAAKGLIANLSKDLKELNLKLPDALAQVAERAASGIANAATTAAAPALVSSSTSTSNAAANATTTAAAQPAQPPYQQPSARPAAASLDARVRAFKAVLLSGGRVDLARLRALAYHGVPDRDGLRALTWKLLLGYLPPDPAGWDALLARKRAAYCSFCDELIIEDPKRRADEAEAGGGNPLRVPLAGGGAGGGGSSGGSGNSEGGGGGGSNNNSGGGGRGAEDGSSSLGPLGGEPLGASAAQRAPARGASDHPLALHQGSAWHEFFRDSEVLQQIDRDVVRTHPDMHFFSGDGDEAERHRREMKRALFLFAKLNPGLRYIQGMNELFAPLYHAFATDTDRDSAQHAEADAFYCFVELISECRDHFCAQLDNSAGGIRATIARLVALVRCIDPQLAGHVFGANRVDPQFFAFRWITLLLTQELPFPDAVRLWDALLADPRGRTDCLLRVCAALLVRARAELLAGDFAANVKLLQRYPAVDVASVLADAEAIPDVDAMLAAAAAATAGGGGGNGSGDGEAAVEPTAAAAAAAAKNVVTGVVGAVRSGLRHTGIGGGPL